ncbi:MAG: hypothetical protein K4H23_04935 [Mollicutes bacterium PWAP]|nr:hypothetical protein [Mollicutes bacterium PWAP]
MSNKIIKFKKILSISLFLLIPIMPISILITKSINTKINPVLNIGAKLDKTSLFSAYVEEEMINHYTNINTKIKTGFDNNKVVNAFEKERIDTIAEFSGTIANIYFGQEKHGFDPKNNNIKFNDLNQFLIKQQNLKNIKAIESPIVDGLGFNNGFTMISRKTNAVSFVNYIKNNKGTIGISDDSFKTTLIGELFQKATGNTEKIPSPSSKDVKNIINWNIKQINISSWKTMLLQDIHKYDLLKNEKIDLLIGFDLDNDFNLNTMTSLKINNLGVLPFYKAGYLFNKNILNKYSNIKLKILNKYSSLEKIISVIHISEKEIHNYLNKSSSDLKYLAHNFLEYKNYFIKNVQKIV